MKLSTKVQIANEIAREKGSRPVLTMNQLWAELEKVKARSRQDAKARITALLWD